MANVQVGDNVISDRRKNGARLKLSFSDWWKIGGVVFAVFAWAFGYAWTVKGNCKTIEMHDKQIAINTGKIGKMETSIELMQKSIERIDRNTVETLRMLKK